MGKKLSRNPLFAVAVSAILAVAHNAFAKSPSADRAGRYANAFYTSTASPGPRENRTSESKPGPVGSACSGTVCAETQAIFLIATIAAIEGMKQANELAGIKREQVSNTDLANAARASVEHVLTASETAAGFLGLAVTRESTKIPLQAFNSLIANSTVRPLLGEFLTSGAANLVGFVGFELGADLVSRAAQMIGDENDRKKAQLLIPTFWSALTSKSESRSKEDWRILGLLLDGVLKTLEDPDLREKWWSFAVRNRIATGDFMAGVSVMTLSTVAASRVANCIPNSAFKRVAPLIVGGVFGITAGVAIGYIPKEGREAVSRGFQNARQKSSALQIGTAQLNSSDLLRRIEIEEKMLQKLGEKRTGNDWRLVNQHRQLDEELQRMAIAREDFFTAHYDRLHQLNARLYETHNKLVLAKEHQNIAAQKIFNGELDHYRKLFASSRKQVDRSLENELEFLNRAFKTTSESAASLKIREQLETVMALKKQTTPFVDQLQSSAMWNEGRQPQSDDLMTEQENQRLLEKIYLWGFKTKTFIQVMEYNN